MMIGNGPLPRVGYSIETSRSLLRVVSRNSAEGMTPTGDEPMLNAYDGEYDVGCGAGVVFCCGVDEHPAAAMIASARAIRFMNPFECKNGRQDFWEVRIGLFVAKLFGENLLHHRDTEGTETAL